MDPNDPSGRDLGGNAKFIGLKIETIKGANAELFEGFTRDITNGCNQKDFAIIVDVGLGVDALADFREDLLLHELAQGAQDLIIIIVLHEVCEVFKDKDTVGTCPHTCPHLLKKSSRLTHFSPLFDTTIRYFLEVVNLRHFQYVNLRHF